MLVTVSSDDQFEALGSLSEWLRRDPELRGTPIRVVRRPPQPGELGSVAEAVQIVTQNGAAVTAAAATLGAWLTARARATKIRVRDGDREVEIEAGRMKDARQVAGEILDRLSASAEDRNRSEPDG